MIQNGTPETNTVDLRDYRATIFQKYLHEFYLEPSTFVLMISADQNTPKLAVHVRARYFYQVLDCTNYSGVSRMLEHVSSYWNHDINASICVFSNDYVSCFVRIDVMVLLLVSNLTKIYIGCWSFLNYR